MPASSYKLWSVGNPVGMGVTGSVYVGMSGVAKKSTPAEPYIVANELLCNFLARAIFLPAPPGGLMEHNGDQYFFSLDFNLAGHALPPASPIKIVSTQPRLAWGVILFDIFVINPDRHTGNIAFDTSANRVTIFDHSHAFASPSGDISARLASLTSELGIGGECLAPVIDTEDGLDLWADRISQLPDFYIRESCSAASEVGLPAANVAECVDFLIDRKSRLRALVDAHRSSFPKVPSVSP